MPRRTGLIAAGTQVRVPALSSRREPRGRLGIVKRVVYYEVEMEGDPSNKPWCKPEELVLTAKPKVWQGISDSGVRSFWQCENPRCKGYLKEHAYVRPNEVADTGIPVCLVCERYMAYVITEIRPLR